MGSIDERTLAGQKGNCNHLLWRCPTASIRALYDRNAGARHLDVGVGTGYYVGRCPIPRSHSSISILTVSPPPGA
jgi:hypothetical protein